MGGKNGKGRRWAKRRGREISCNNVFEEEEEEEKEEEEEEKEEGEEEEEEK